MQSLEISSVTNARASGDYHPGNDQWLPLGPNPIPNPGLKSVRNPNPNPKGPLGTTGIFAWAVAIGPTKDNFWSTPIQSGSSYSDHNTIKESYGRLQSAVSTLSKGPVAPSDKIGASDSKLILKSCMSDGRLLQVCLL